MPGGWTVQSIQQPVPSPDKRGGLASGRASGHTKSAPINLPWTVILRVNLCWYMRALKTWSGYMHVHVVNTIVQWWKYTRTCVLQFFLKQKQQQYSIQWSMNMMTNDKYADDYLHANNPWKQFMEHRSIGCRRRCPDVGNYKHWKHGVSIWTWTWMQWIHASNGESIDAHVYYNC